MYTMQACAHVLTIMVTHHPCDFLHKMVDTLLNAYVTLSLYMCVCCHRESCSRMDRCTRIGYRAYDKLFMNEDIVNFWDL